MARTHCLHEGLIRGGDSVVRMESVARSLRTFARAHGLDRPDLSQPIMFPRGFLSALIAPLFAQDCVARVEAGGAISDLQVVTLHECQTAPAVPGRGLLVRVARDAEGRWSAECTQDGQSVARVLFVTRGSSTLAL
jgi:hypothetical protein